MKIENIKNISISFFYWWYNQGGNNTEQGFDDYIKNLKSGICLCLAELEIGYAMRKFAIAEYIKADEELVTILLKELKNENKVELMMIFSEDTGMANGSGYCLKQKTTKL